MKQNAAIYARVSSDRQKEEKTIASVLLRQECVKGEGFAG